MVRRPLPASTFTSSASSTFSNDISETAWPIYTKLNVEPPWGGEQKFVCKVWIT